VALDRYAAHNEDYVPVVDPHGGPGARSAPGNTDNQPRGSRGDIKGEPLGWLVQPPTDTPDKAQRPVLVVSPDPRNHAVRATTVLVVPMSTTPAGRVKMRRDAVT
jgi:hypothetical protein